MLNFNFTTSNDHLHIRRVAGNDTGCDYITTDPHGCLDVLKIVVADLQENDRLFLCGDLVDRGAESLGTIRYVNNQIAAGKSIYAVRGNHEDIVLKAIQQARVMDELIAQKDTEGSITQLELVQIRLSEALKKLAQKYKCKKSKDIHDYEDAIFIGKELIRISNTSQSHAMRSFCNDVMGMAINNGAGWVFGLSEEERKEVEAFIKPLPYMIRVDEAKQGEVSSFDIVHAAPLSEPEIRSALQADNPQLTKRQIGYMTWARPVDQSTTADPEKYRIELENNPVLEADNHDYNQTLISNHRTSFSTPTYAGHNALKSSAEVFAHINVVNLDVGTVFTDTMCVANHTDLTLKLVNPSSIKPDSQSNPPSPKSPKIPKSSTIDDELNTSVDSIQKVMQQLQSNMPTKHADDMIQQEVKEMLNLHSNGLESLDISDKDDNATIASTISVSDEISATALKEFKINYLSILKEKIEAMTVTERIKFARYLLESKNHPLAKERDYSATKTCCFWSRSSEYSHQTRSMHQAIGMLLAGIKTDDSISIVKFLASPTKVIVNSNGEPKETFDFNRYRRYI